MTEPTKSPCPTCGYYGFPCKCPTPAEATRGGDASCTSVVGVTPRSEKEPVTPAPDSSSSVGPTPAEAPQEKGETTREELVVARRIVMNVLMASQSEGASLGVVEALRAAHRAGRRKALEEAKGMVQSARRPQDYYAWLDAELQKTKTP